MLSTPFTESIFLTRSFLMPSFFKISYGPLLDTFFSGRNLSELGFGVISV
jgi:hypothetical protein